MPHLLDTLLKTPELLIDRIVRRDGLPALSFQLLLWGLLLHALYGGVSGLFASREVALLAAGKAPLIALGAALLCLPSFYVFACLGGLPLRPAQACALCAVLLGTTGLLLLGLVPVAWLFSVSTDSLPFVVTMHLVAWSIAVGFGIRVLGLLHDEEEPRRGRAGLVWWLLIYVLVSLQMTTTLRPLLVRPAQGWRDTGKKFFLAHFAEALSIAP